ncbi:MAG: hypothetical protein LVO36_01560, partial [Nitrosopumilus sp. (ex Thoosa mismalolli)]|nr:hypothetical protein [Nitrosopumilus sp. (ex Thoosa mismalolli)]
VVAVSMAATFTIDNDSYVYVPSDITKANSNLKIGNTSASMSTDIDYAKKFVVLTVSGEVKSVGDPIPWSDDAGNKHGAVPVTIEIDKKAKDETIGLMLKKDDLFTFYVDSIYHNGQYYVWQHEPQFEIGEKTIVHISNSEYGPDGYKGNNFVVEIGKYGKYKVVDEKAYNEHHEKGKPLDKAFAETQ